MPALSNHHTKVISLAAAGTSLLASASFGSEAPRITEVHRESGTGDVLLKVEGSSAAYNIYAADALNPLGDTNAFYLAQESFPASAGTVWRDNGTFTFGHPAAAENPVRFYRVEGLSEALPYYVSNLWPIVPAGWQFPRVTGIAADRGGNLYVVDYTEQRLKIFNGGGKLLGDMAMPDLGYYSHPALDEQGNLFVTTWKGISKYTAGRQVGEFRYEDSGNPPMYIEVTVDRQGHVYAGDASNWQIHKFDNNGNHLLTIGKAAVNLDQDLTPGEFYNSSYTLGVAVDSAGFLYVADNHFARITKIAPDGAVVDTWAENLRPVIDWQLGSIFTIDENDVLHLAHEHSTAIRRFDTALKELEPILVDPMIFWGHNYQKGAAITGDGMYIVGDRPVWDSWGYEIIKLDHTGQAQATWTSASLQDGHFINPISIGTDSAGAVYVADNAHGGGDFNGRVQKFSADGVWIRSDTYGNWVDRVVVDAQRNLYVVFDNNTLARFTPDGERTMECDFKASLPSSYVLKDVAVDAQQNVLFRIDPLDPSVPYAYKFDRDGEFASAWPLADDLSNPVALAVDPAGRIFVLDGASGDLVRVDSDGNQLSRTHLGFYGGNVLSMRFAGTSLFLFGYGGEISQCRVDGETVNSPRVIIPGSSFGTGAGVAIQRVDFAVGPDSRIYTVDKSRSQVTAYSPRL